MLAGQGRNSCHGMACHIPQMRSHIPQMMCHIPHTSTQHHGTALAGLQLARVLLTMDRMVHYFCLQLSPVHQSQPREGILQWMDVPCPITSAQGEEKQFDIPPHHYHFQCLCSIFILVKLPHLQLRSTMLPRLPAALRAN